MEIVFHKNRRKHGVHIRLLSEAVRGSFNKYQKEKSIQQVITPVELVLEMLKEIDTLDNKEVLVVANVEILSMLQNLERNGHINPKGLYLLTDVKDLESKKNIFVRDFGKIEDINLGMKFDVVIGNPPYNEEDTQREAGSHRKQGKNLAKDFLLLAEKLSNQFVLIIGPVSRVYTAGVKKYLVKKGLYRVRDVKHYFPKVDLSGIVTYCINKKAKTTLEDCTEFNVPDRNLGSLFTFSTATVNSRKVVEPLLSETGIYKVFVTTSKIMYTDDINIVNFIDDKSRGSWRVVMNNVASVDSVGRLAIAAPEDTLCYSTSCFIVQSREQAQAIIDLLSTDEIKQALKSVRYSVTNSAKSFKAIPIPY